MTGVATGHGLEVGGVVVLWNVLDIRLLELR